MEVHTPRAEKEMSLQIQKVSHQVLSIINKGIIKDTHLHISLENLRTRWRKEPKNFQIGKNILPRKKELECINLPISHNGWTKILKYLQSSKEKNIFNLEFYVYQTINKKKCKIKSHVPFLWKLLKHVYQENKMNTKKGRHEIQEIVEITSTPLKRNPKMRIVQNASLTQFK